MGSEFCFGFGPEGIGEGGLFGRMDVRDDGFRGEDGGQVGDGQVGRGDVVVWEGEGAEEGIVDEVLDELARCGGVLLLARDAGEVGAGDGEAAEEGAGVLIVDGVAGGEAEDFAEAALDGVEVFGRGEDDEGEAMDGLVGGGAAASVVVEAELFATEGGAAALAAFGEDVAAAVGFRLGLWDRWDHGEFSVSEYA